MTISFGFFHDSALTQPVNSDNPMAASHVVGASDSTDKTVYFGSGVTGNKLQKSVNPGTDPIVVSVVDENSSTGAPASEFRLAMSSGGLAAATPGAALTLSTTILSGVANAVPVYTRRTSTLSTAGAYTDISLQTNPVTESAV